MAYAQAYITKAVYHFLRMSYFLVAPGRSILSFMKHSEYYDRQLQAIPGCVHPDVAETYTTTGCLTDRITCRALGP